MLAKLAREVHLVDGLKANMLVGIDVIRVEGFIIDTPGRTVTLPSYAGARFYIDVKRHRQ